MLEAVEQDLFQSMKAIRMENNMVKLVFLPEYGANLWSIFYKPSEAEILWHHPTQTPQVSNKNRSYDEQFFGGWHEIFPNDLTEEYQGRQLVDHGELWFSKWEYSISKNKNNLALSFSTVCDVTPAKFKKEITLKKDNPGFQIRYEINNSGTEEFDFMFKIHAALRIDQDDRIISPASRHYMEDIGLPGRLPSKAIYKWPVAATKGKTIDMSVVPARSTNFSELQYGLDMEGDICGLRKFDDRYSFWIKFNSDDFQTFWTFATYGGWKDYYTLILEPCTGYPQWLNKAQKGGILCTLQPDETFNTKVTTKITRSNRLTF